MFTFLPLPGPTPEKLRDPATSAPLLEHAVCRLLVPRQRISLRDVSSTLFHTFSMTGSG